MRRWLWVIGLVGCRPFPDALPPCEVGAGECGPTLVCTAEGRCVERTAADAGPEVGDGGLDLDRGAEMPDAVVGADAGPTRDAEPMDAAPRDATPRDATPRDAAPRDADVPPIPECGCDETVCYVEVGCGRLCPSTAPTIAEALEGTPAQTPLIVTHCGDGVPFDVIARDVTLRSGTQRNVDIDATGLEGITVQGGGRLRLENVRIFNGRGAGIAAIGGSELDLFETIIESNTLGLSVEEAEVRLESVTLQGNRSTEGTTAGIRCLRGRILGNDVAIQANAVNSPVARAGAIDAVGCELDFDFSAFGDNEVTLDEDVGANAPEPAGSVWVEGGRFVFTEGRIGPDSVTLPRAATTATLVSLDAHVQLRDMALLGLTSALGTVLHIDIRGVTGARPIELAEVVMQGLGGLENGADVRLRDGLVVISAVPQAQRVTVMDVAGLPTEVPFREFYCTPGSCSSGTCEARCPRAWPCAVDDPCSSGRCDDGFCR